MDNSLTRWKKNLFLKFLFREIRKIPYENSIFPEASSTNFFALHCHYTGDTQYRVSFDLDNSLTRWKRFFFKFSKFRNSRNSQNSVWKTIFFLGKQYQQLLALDCHYIGDTQYRVWFDLDNSLTRWRRTFLKFIFREICKIPYKNPLFFRGKLYQFYFALHCHYNGDTQYRVWFDLDNSLTRWNTTIFKILKNSQFAKFAKFRMKTQLFPRQALPILFCFTLSLHWWYSIPSLIWFGQLLDPLKKNFFLKFSKIRNSRNSQNSVWKPTFFRGKLYQFYFALHSHYTGDTQYRVWFDLDNSLTRWKKIKLLKNSQFAKFAKFRMKTELCPKHALPKFFALHSHYIGDTPYPDWFDLDNSLTRWKKPIFKIPFSRNSQKFRTKTQFFSEASSNNFFLLYTLITLLILNIEFGLIWTTPWPAEKKLNFSKIRNSRNSQNSVWKPNFFLGKLYQYFFCLTLSLNWWNSIPRLVWFGQLLNPMKKNLFLKLLFREIRKIPYENSVFSRGQLYQFFCFTLSLHWWYSMPSLVWFGQLLDPMKKIFFKFLKISQFAKFAKFRMKNHFFPRQAIPTTFGFTLSLHCLYSIPSLVWFGQRLGPMKMKKDFFKIPFSRNSQNSVRKPTFFRGKLYQFYFALHCHYTGDTQYPVWFDLVNSFTRWNTTIFKILKNSQFAKFAKFRMKTQLFPRQALPILFCFTLSLHWWYSIPRLV